METKKPLLFSPGAILCAVFDHRFEISQNITNHIKEYRCTRCGEEMTDTAQGFMAKLTPKFKETNAYLAKIHQRRCARKLFGRKVLSEAS